MIQRSLQSQIENDFFKQKVLVIYGARQVGKTTLIQNIQAKFPEKSLYLNCDEPDIRETLTDSTSTQLKALIGDKTLVFIDEAQRVKNIGLTLKLLVDNLPTIQVVTTGSSSFDLSNQIVEPLTGRKYEYYLYPFSLGELQSVYSNLEIKRILERRMIYGMYPEIVQKEAEAGKILKDITRSYLFGDILQYQQVKNPNLLEKLLQALALQIGNEVSYNELANLLGIDKKTVVRYVELLEKAFIIFTLKPFSRNLRKELTKLRKIYFLDAGIRNTLINNLNPLNLRGDVGPLWENFAIVERLKWNNQRRFGGNCFFWRTHQQQEVDYLEEVGQNLAGFEFKWSEEKLRASHVFQKNYPNSQLQLINNKTYETFFGLE
ncbi:ATPase [bacterium CG2_30_54_10]|nr:MAG: ATPase [bacterium CG2_30_54_10]